MISRKTIKAAVTSLDAMSVPLAMVMIGSHKLQHIDTALFAYLFSMIFAFFGFTYCNSMWIQRQFQMWATEQNHGAIRFYRRAEFQTTESRQLDKPVPSLNKLLFSLNLSKVGQPGARS